MMQRADAETTDDIFAALSELDKSAVGAEGWSAESFRSEAEKSNGFVLYVTVGKEIAALLTGYCAVGEADITSVAVKPDFRRKGLAKGLIEEFIRLQSPATEDIFLEVRESNGAAVALYEKCGFERISVRKNFYSSPRENAVVMKKTIQKG
jgi:ribosomal-protein-alanine N-acetyltransferase